MADIDSKLASALSEQLTRDPRTADSPIEVIDNNGIVTLSGVALSNEARGVAAEIAINHPGVLSVINDLEVNDPDATSEVAAIPPLPTDLTFRQ